MITPKKILNTLKKKCLLKASVMLFLLTLTACQTNTSIPLTEQNKVEEKLLQTPIRQSLVVPCRVAYPLRNINEEATLRQFYEVSIYNLGQVQKCYDKDEALIKEIKERDYVVED